jgi:transcriptional repressor OPI1
MPDYIRSPTRSVTLSAREGTAEPEPLLNLLTSAHPWLGGSINGSISAYNTTKTYSPSFVKYGAELIERNIGSPVVNTVSSVGRRTGVEQNLRRYLGEIHRRPSDIEQADDDISRKRQKVRSRESTDDMDMDVFGPETRTRGASHSSYAESLPAYDDHRSPRYEENAEEEADSTTEHKGQEQSSASQERRVNWSTQLIMTTSGLGVALSDASLRSLKACLRILRNATKHIDDVMRALKLVMEEYETALRNNQQSNGQMYDDTKHTSHVTTTELSDPSRDENVRLIASRMQSLSSNIWSTIQQVVRSVNQYTGGALPQNASQVVRTQLMSVPQRWHLTSRNADPEQGEEVRSASRMLAFASEGLDMMGQITAVVDGTVQSAEGWLSRIGRRPCPPSEPSEPSEKSASVEPHSEPNEKR